MATPRLCLVLDCGKRHKARGYCENHWHRLMKHGDPLGGRTPVGEITKYVRDVVLAYSADDCLVWPYARNRKGYGVTPGGIASRLICAAVNGPPPTPKHEASHSCGSGHLGCVNPKHLSWKTSAGNKADAAKHGTQVKGASHGAALLTDADVINIRRLSVHTKRRELAKRYGVANNTIAAILTGVTWKHLSNQE